MKKKLIARLEEKGNLEKIGKFQATRDTDDTGSATFN